MRNVKFRAWEKNLQQMIPVYNIDFSKRMINTESAWRLFDEIELMQYTQLQDKNGKEIYEGDLCVDGDGRSLMEVVWSHNYQWGCRMAKGGALSRGLTFPLWHWDKCPQNDFRELEVIGNIYEHTHLIGFDQKG